MPHLVSRDFVAPNGRSRAHIANILNYATPGLTNKKRLGTPLLTFMLRKSQQQTLENQRLASMLHFVIDSVQSTKHQGGATEHVLSI